eukprot:gene10215-12527_t
MLKENSIFFQKSIDFRGGSKVGGYDDSVKLDDTYSKFNLFRTIGSIQLIISTQRDLYAFYEGTKGSDRLINLSLLFETSDPLFLSKGSLPCSIKNLTIRVNDKFKYIFQYRGLLEKGTIPNSTEKLKLNHKFFRHDIGLIPESVSNLAIDGFKVKQNVDGYLIPHNVTILTLENGKKKRPFPPNFQQKPYTITELQFEFNYTFSEPFLPEELPSSIRKFIMGSSSHPTYFGSLPASLEEFRLSSFTKSIPSELLPKGLKYLTCGVGKIPNDPPKTLIDLRTWNLSTDYQFLQLTPNLVNLVCRSKTLPVGISSFLPQTLEFFVCPFEKIEVGFLPSSLKTIILDSKILVIEKGAFPESLTNIVFNQEVSVPLVHGILPSNLKEISFVLGFSNIETIILPDSIEKLNIGGLKKTDKIKLPSSLKSLFLSSISEPLESYSIEIPKTLGNLTIQTIYDGTKLQKKLDLYKNLCNSILNLISNSTNRLKISLRQLVLLSLDKYDSYLYYYNSIMEGFIKKSNIIPNKNNKNSSLFDLLVYSDK